MKRVHPALQLRILRFQFVNALLCRNLPPLLLLPKDRRVVLASDPADADDAWLTQMSLLHPLALEKCAVGRTHISQQEPARFRYQLQVQGGHGLVRNADRVVGVPANRDSLTAQLEQNVVRRVRELNAE